MKLVKVTSELFMQNHTLTTRALSLYFHYLMDRRKLTKQSRVMKPKQPRMKCSAPLSLPILNTDPVLGMTITLHPRKRKYKGGDHVCSTSSKRSKMSSKSFESAIKDLVKKHEVLNSTAFNMMRQAKENIGRDSYYELKEILSKILKVTEMFRSVRMMVQQIQNCNDETLIRQTQDCFDDFEQTTEKMRENFNKLNDKSVDHVCSTSSKRSKMSSKSFESAIEDLVKKHEVFNSTALNMMQQAMENFVRDSNNEKTSKLLKTIEMCDSLKMLNVQKIKNCTDDVKEAQNRIDILERTRKRLCEKLNKLNEKKSK